MATLLFTAVGTLVGGPLGGAIGALAGRQIDSAIIGGGSSHEGARLKDLQVTTSSYGQPFPRHFGQVRTAGTIIWSTDLIESEANQGGGKGKPEVTTFSYTVSFAVALSSTPIARIGKIWADGNLLTHTGGALAGGGSMRIYRGFGDQPVDPLIASDVGSGAPAFRDLAYIVFEDLPVGDFGNRIPAFTFELFAEESSVSGGSLTAPLPQQTSGDAGFARLAGFSHEGGSIRSALALLDAAYPMTCDISGSELLIERRQDYAASVITLPETATFQTRDTGTAQESSRDRDGSSPALSAVRYYDIERDYQPSLQRATGRAVGAANRTLEFPGTLAATDALQIVDDAAARGRARADTMRWRIAELDPAIRPGAVVSLPGRAGRWIVESWEWYDAGIELNLSRLRHTATFSGAADSGAFIRPPDTVPWPTWLSAFELPWDGTGSPSQRQVYIAASAGGAGWRGAAIYDASQNALEPVTSVPRTRSTVGTLASALPPSAAFTFENRRTADIDLLAADMTLSSTDMAGISNGRNRLLVGSEILQFARAEQIGEACWRLTGLLRGRAGTEIQAAAGHAPGTSAILLDARLRQIPAEKLGGAGREIVAAIGRFDAEAVTTEVDTSLRTRNPFVPVHPAIATLPDGGTRISWIRRARGRWAWLDGVDVPLVEARERYLVGLGTTANPVESWEVESAAIDFSAAAWIDLASNYPGRILWVRQIGDFGLSPALRLVRLSSP